MSILLILVIGMVGVFAAQIGTANLLLKTDVPAYDAMAIVSTTTNLTATNFQTTLDDQGEEVGAEYIGYSSFTTTSGAVDLGDTTTQTVGKLYTYSNRRIYSVEITATALSSTSDSGITSYIDYTVTGGNDGTTDTPYSTNGATSVAAVVFYNHKAVAADATSGARIGANGIQIGVTMITPKSTVPSGEYNGAITFNYIAN